MIKLPKILEYLWYLFLFLIPWQTRLIFRSQNIDGFVWEYGQLSFYAFDLVFLLMLVLFLVAKKRTTKITFTRENIFLILFFLFVSVSLFWSSDRLLTGYFLLRFVQFIVLLSVIPGISFSRVRAFGVFCVSLLFSSLVGLWQFFTGLSPACKWLGLAGRDATRLGDSVVWDFAGDRFLRAYGSFPHPNILAGFLVIVLLVLFYLMVSNQSPKKQKKICLFFSLIFLVTLVFTFSRAAYLALALGVLLFYIFRFIKRGSSELDLKILNKITFLVVVVFLVVFNFFPSLFLNRFGVLENIFPSNKSDIERVSHLEDSREMISQNLSKGVGLGAYTGHLQDIYPEREVWQNQPVHSVYLLLLAELGLVGFLLLGLTIFFFSKKNWTLMNSVQKILFLVILFMFFFDHFWLTNISSLFLVCLGLLAIPKKRSQH